jgi:hypothetical protein
MFYPGIAVGVQLTSGKYQTFEFILDSGADCTVVPNFLATMAGVKLSPTPDAFMTGVAGISMPCYKGKLNLKIKEHEFTVRCLFTDSDTTPLLIGRIDFFSTFTILFDGDGCSIELVKRKPKTI